MRSAPAPQPWQPVRPPADAREIEFSSGGYKLRAWVSAAAGSGTAPVPAVLFLHGGFAFGADDWDMTRPFRDAGFVVMVPILRGENGSPGAFSLYYDEVDDVLAAAEALLKQPRVDPKRLYVTGHSAGGTLTMLAALASNRFRAAAALSGSPELRPTSGERELPFDPTDDNEYRMRSPLDFAAGFRCPTRLYFGDRESWADAPTRETSRRAKASGLDVEAVPVPGDHFSMLSRALPLALAFFQQQR